MKPILIAAALVVSAGLLPVGLKPVLGAEDSPMVAAAKKTNRAKKPGIVITDETLKTMQGGHVTTSKIVYSPPPLLPTAIVPPGAKVYKREPPKKAEVAKPKRPPMEDGDDYLDGDETAPVQPASPSAPRPSATSQPKKP